MIIDNSGAVKVFAKLWNESEWREAGTCETLPHVNRYGWCHIVMLPRSMEDIGYLGRREKYSMNFKFSTSFTPDVEIEGSLFSVELHSDFGSPDSIDLLLDNSRVIDPSDGKPAMKLYAYDAMAEQWNIIASVSKITGSDFGTDDANTHSFNSSSNWSVPHHEKSHNVELDVDSVGLLRTSRMVGMEHRYEIVTVSTEGKRRRSPFTGKIKSAQMSAGCYGGGKVIMEVGPDYARSTECDVYHILFPFDPIQEWADRELARIEDKYKWIRTLEKEEGKKRYE